MSLVDQIGKDIVAAMKAHDALRLETLRMVKTAFKNKEIEKRSAAKDEGLTDAEAVQILTTLVKQRKESIEAFIKGNRPELAQKEAAEIVFLEGYMPQAAGAEEIAATVAAVIAEMTAAGGARPTPREIGGVMKAVQARIQASGVRADGKVVSEVVKAALATALAV